MLAGTLIVLSLYTFSEYRSNRRNGFVRQYPSKKVEGIRFIDLRYTGFYIAGCYADTLYFGHTRNKFTLFMVALSTRDTASIRLRTSLDLKLYDGNYLRTDGNNLYIFDGIKQEIVSGKIGVFSLDKTEKSPSFTAALPIENDSRILRVMNKKRVYTLIKQSGANVQDKHYVLEAQGDGTFSTDGMLVKCSDSSFFYVYYYRNQFLHMDKDMDLLYKGKTIDTVSYAKIKLGKIENGRAITFAAPPLYVNKHCAANEKYLFVHSALKADNEIKKAWDSSSVIDVYTVRNGKYQFSFYISNKKDQKLKDFKVYGDTLVALYENFIYTYKLKF
ncbi:hypothetical protein [Pedobacter frigoris]|uniref:Uncharacterized protein n=1 Tax=Pedobacter frigoris TaxID=2571272 RepID=A0A4U1CDK7_9SPHI|nr:hypothetical protein [Pedobacter frigoris]TKC04218.1 hypothetical protein FA047_16600 [Pedobacter frigoris]